MDKMFNINDLVNHLREQLGHEFTQAELENAVEVFVGESQ